MLDGAVLAAQAVGAEEAILCVLETIDLDAPQRALAERQKHDGGSPKIRLATVPERYVAGQESALVNHLNGGPALPTFTPPMPFERGVGRRPTLVSNAETLAHLALIARHGSGWFRQLGTASEPGSTLVTLSGPIAYPGVYEIEQGASLTSLLEAAGGATSPLRAVLLGGYAGTWVGADLLRGLALSAEHLAPHGATLGAGVIALLSEDACGGGRDCARDALDGAAERRPVRPVRARPATRSPPASKRSPPARRAARPASASPASRRSRAGAAPADTPMGPCASSSARSRCSPRTSPITPATGSATPAGVPASCRSPSPFTPPESARDGAESMRTRWPSNRASGTDEDEMSQWRMR